MSKQKGQASTKYWCFTSFHDNEGFMWYLPEQMAYLVQQEEISPSTGALHWQGFVVFDVRKRLTAIKSLLPSAHFEPMRGSVDEAADYCSDPRKRRPGGLFLEDGIRPLYGNAARSKSAKANYNIAWDQAVRGEFEQIDKSIMWRHLNTAFKIHTMFGKRAQNIVSDKTPGVWLYGEAGSGKSTFANTYPHYSKDPANKWFDAYQGERIVVVDDFAPYHIAQTHILKMLGHQFAFQGEVKGAAIWLRPRVCIITSQYRIEQIWSEEKDPESAAAINRRYKVFTVPLEVEEAHAYIKAMLEEPASQCSDGLQQTIQATSTEETDHSETGSGPTEETAQTEC